MNVKKSGSTVSKVYDISKPIAESLGLKIWDVVYEKEGSLYYLRVFIDRATGISMDDCENMSRALSKTLDEKDPVSGSYILEVGSPGLGRTLRRPEHFEEFLDCPVRIRYIRERDGVKEFIAVMTAYDRETNTLTAVKESDETVSVKVSDTAFVKLCDDENLFDEPDNES